ncbi:MAG TPA: hypothetical protein DDW52_29835 [Planctomycetaceae bacterium]|nr:hypothetical protein [Planctomycetaceae bacterium]
MMIAKRSSSQRSSSPTDQVHWPPTRRWPAVTNVSANERWQFLMSVFVHVRQSISGVDAWANSTAIGRFSIGNACPSFQNRTPQ